MDNNLRQTLEWKSLRSVAEELNTTVETIWWRTNYFNNEFPNESVELTKEYISTEAIALVKRMDAYLRHDETDVQGFIRMLRHQKAVRRDAEPIELDPVLMFESQSKDIIDVSSSPIEIRTKPSRSCPDLSGSCPDLSGSCHDLSGSCPDLSGSCPDLSGSCPDLSGSCPDLSGQKLSNLEYNQTFPLPDVAVRKLEDFFSYDQRLSGYFLLEHLAEKQSEWGLSAKNLSCLIDFTPRLKFHSFDCFALVRKKHKTPIRGEDGRTRKVYTWFVRWLREFPEFH